MLTCISLALQLHRWIYPARGLIPFVIIQEVDRVDNILSCLDTRTITKDDIRDPHSLVISDILSLGRPPAGWCHER